MVAQYTEEMFMRLATFRPPGADASRGDATWGLVLGEEVVDVPRAAAGRPGADRFAPTLKGQIARFGTDTSALADLAAALLADRGLAPEARHRLDAVALLPPLPDPGKVICVGKNNRTHLEELKRNQLITEMPEEPTGFIKLNACLVGQDAEVERPDGIVEFDYEPELAFVIARRAHRVRKEDAMDHVFAVSLLNDLTAREIQRREVRSGTRFWTAKNMPGFGPFGPFLVTLDESGDPADMWLSCTVNGRERLRFHTGDQIFQIPDIIAHFSRFVVLEPGDVFTTGSPHGVAVGQPNASELFLRPGDRVEVAAEGLMTLRTSIV
ncbi:fumarylacetoacetate hydrolase family protein [Xanthobacter tagetidis]|jgi:2-keto-4-pentenoate hydratase/2-oxohepta-3-ene-1,7-dioic acid hydratase in catechol pathway|nr:fumarylacetoacetate hydrolase family protein [Xanthobacter tagetidis]MBB6307733.1 2-keto-4-pentenoate hydratase/2-oxohepta-3-ene-1,7-dioic acid hydratase in catechol pathway [Xanthobacter tagetidis]